jgi:hypothetical protein
MRIKCRPSRRRAITIQHHDAPHNGKENVIRAKRRLYIANGSAKIMLKL